MPKTIQEVIERIARNSGLRGERRAQYIGTAWQQITQGGERKHAGWREKDEAEALGAALGGEVTAIRQPLRVTPGHFAVCCGGTWYEVSIGEYDRLIRAGRKVAAKAGKAAKSA